MTKKKGKEKREKVSFEREKSCVTLLSTANKYNTDGEWHLQRGKKPTKKLWSA